MKVIEAVDQREKGSIIPISIGTSLALDAAEGQYPERPVVHPPPIAAVDCLLINVRTLLRNLIGAVNREYKDRLQAPHLVPALVEEMRIVDAYIAERTNGRCVPVFYLSLYEHLTQVNFRGALFKVPNTPKQLADAGIEKHVVELLMQRELPVRMMLFKGGIEGKFPRTFILSHHPVDLLARKQFTKLELLESHTGAIKPHGLWGTKLTGSNLDHIPFNAFTLKVFGDGVQFSGQRPSVKKALLEVAALDHWTGLSTMPLIENSIGKIKDQTIRESLRELL